MLTASLLLALAIWLNKDDKRMLLLTLLVGLSYFLPVHLITDRGVWYAVCIGAELFVLCSALLLRTKASWVITTLCVMLIFNHFVGLCFNGHLESSPYQSIVPYLEYVELLSCSLFSTKIITRLKGLCHAQC